METETVSEFDKGWTAATLNLFEIWRETKENYIDPEKIVASMDSFWLAVAMKLAGLPQDQVESFLYAAEHSL